MCYWGSKEANWEGDGRRLVRKPLKQLRSEVGDQNGGTWKEEQKRERDPEEEQGVSNGHEK